MPFQAIKTRSSKSPKLEILPKGLSYGFGPKVDIFPSCFFNQYRPRKCVFDILVRKNAFLGYKNKKFKKSKFVEFSPKTWTNPFRRMQIFDFFKISFFLSIQVFFFIQNITKLFFVLILNKNNNKLELSTKTMD